MDCPFQVGDEVVCIDAGPTATGYDVPLNEGAHYTVSRIVPPGGGYRDDGWALRLAEVNARQREDQGFLACRFRKVQRRNDSLSIEAFRVIQDGGFEEPRRAPAKKRERVS